jgi:2-polyprenyl-3-methyl-5-hydroxy-6-metoxy-1,4-benzoquinol methylase
MMSAHGYIFNNASEAAVAHHQALAALDDNGSFEHILGSHDDYIGGLRVWIVGAGGGSLAHRLATAVGRSGHVLATDLDTRHIGPADKLTVQEHNIVTDPIPAEWTFNIILARHLLNHLPDREMVVHRLVGALAPGGVLIVEDWRPLPDPAAMVAWMPGKVEVELYARFQGALFGVLTARGNDRSWPTRAHRVMVAEGLVHVDTSSSSTTWYGGGPGCRLQQASLLQIGEELAEQGFNGDDQRRVYELLANPRVALHGHPLYRTQGWRRTPGDDDDLGWSRGEAT